MIHNHALRIKTIGHPLLGTELYTPTACPATGITFLVASKTFFPAFSYTKKKMQLETQNISLNKKWTYNFLSELFEPFGFSLASKNHQTDQKNKKYFTELHFVVQTLKTDKNSIKSIVFILFLAKVLGKPFFVILKMFFLVFTYISTNCLICYDIFFNCNAIQSRSPLLYSQKFSRTFITYGFSASRSKWRKAHILRMCPAPKFRCF